MYQGEVPDGAAVDLDDSSWCDVTIGNVWGGSEEPTWFRAWFEVPERWKCKRLRLVLHLSKGPEQEALLYINGEPKQGLDRDHGDYLFANSATAGKKYLIAVCASCLGRDGLAPFKPKKWRIDQAEVQVIDKVTEEFYFDALVALEVAETLAPNSPERITIVENLTQALKLVDFQGPAGLAFYATVEKAKEWLRERVYDAMQSRVQWKAACIGNAHIDLAWLWSMEETRRKCARTFSTVLSLMEQYDYWYFIQSQPQFYEFLRRDYPQIYKGIKKYVIGRWEATGAMWVEADTTLVSGESLVRQILFGTRFLRQEFGVVNTLLWLPDSFGFTAALPQILVKSGVKYFMTTKMSWNEFNRIPMDTFRWVGIDGSEVLTHFITSPMRHHRLQREVHTFRGDASVKQIQGAWEKYLQRGINKTVLYAYGCGDGGGGPTREMLERLKRLANFPGVGQCQHRRAEDFFKNLSPAVNWPRWDGELYFECHRGVFTTRARNKRSNRKCELLYREAELFSVWAQQLGKSYPQGELNEGWKELLRNQCHDILAGVCVRAVHDQCERDYALIEAVGKQARDAAHKHIASRINIQGADLAIVVFNSLSWKCTDIVTVEVEVRDAFELLDPKGNRVPYQVISASLNRQTIIFEAKVPSCGYATYRIRKVETSPQDADTGEELPRAQDGVLENKFFKIEVSPAGEITSLCDKAADRQVLPKDDKGKLRPANVFQWFWDKPLVYEAWDIDLSYYQKKIEPEVTIESARVIESGPVRAGIEVKRRFKREVGDREFVSGITQRIYIYASIPRIDFETEVDWQEEQTLLKVAFPVDVHSDHATYDIQFGNIERPTHWNTSWDLARFEVWGHKWADLSEGEKGGYGVSLLNDCKYGWDIKGNVMRLTLLRSPKEPDPEVDRGKHCFTYALYPHQGDWRDADTVRQAYQLNCPLVPVVEKTHSEDRSLPLSFSFVSVDCKNVVVETVKKAEDDDRTIVRIYECQGKSVKEVTLTLGGDIAEKSECNLMEEASKCNSMEEEPTRQGNKLTTSIEKYEIKTFRLKFAQKEEPSVSADIEPT